MQQNIFFLHRPEYRTFLIQIRHTHRCRDLLFQLFPFRIGQFGKVLQIQVTPANHQVVACNTESIAYKRKEIFRHRPIVHKTTQRPDLPFLYLLTDAFHDIPFLILQINIGIAGYLDTITTVYLITRKYIRQIRPDNIVDEHDVKLPFMLGQLDETGYFGIRDLHQGIMELRRLVAFRLPLALLYHTDHQV